MVYKSSGEIERLQRVRMNLESRLAAIDGEQKTLKDEIRGIRQKALEEATGAILELQESVRKRRDELARLHLWKKRLEDKLNGS